MRGVYDHQRFPFREQEEEKGVPAVSPKRGRVSHAMVTTDTASLPQQGRDIPFLPLLGEVLLAMSALPLLLHSFLQELGWSVAMVGTLSLQRERRG